MDSSSRTNTRHANWGRWLSSCTYRLQFKQITGVCWEKSSKCWRNACSFRRRKEPIIRRNISHHIRRHFLSVFVRTNCILQSVQPWKILECLNCFAAHSRPHERSTGCHAILSCIKIKHLVAKNLNSNLIKNNAYLYEHLGHRILRHRNRFTFWKKTIPDCFAWKNLEYLVFYLPDSSDIRSCQFVWNVRSCHNIRISLP